MSTEYENSVEYKARKKLLNNLKSGDIIKVTKLSEQNEHEKYQEECGILPGSQIYLLINDQVVNVNREPKLISVSFGLRDDISKDIIFNTADPKIIHKRLCLNIQSIILKKLPTNISDNNFSIIILDGKEHLIVSDENITSATEAGGGKRARRKKYRSKKMPKYKKKHKARTFKRY